MKTEVLFRCGGRNLVLKFENAPTFTIVGKRITLSSAFACIHSNSSEDWKDYFEFYYSKEGILEVAFKVEINYLSITPYLFSFEADFLITGHNENGDEI